MDLEEIDNGIERALQAVAKVSGADRAYVFLYHEDNELADNTHEWYAKGLESRKELLKNIPIKSDLPWFSDHIQRWEIVAIPNVASLPPEARFEREHFEKQGTFSHVSAPMVLRNRLVGFIGFGTISKKRKWTENDLVVTDMTMPQITGSQLAREILKVRNDMPIILCTGFSDKIDEDAAKAMGIKHFLMKPIEINFMADAVRRVLDEK